MNNNLMEGMGITKPKREINNEIKDGVEEAMDSTAEEKKLDITIEERRKSLNEKGFTNEMINEIVDGIKALIKNKQIFFLYGDHGYFDVAGYVGKIFAFGESLLDTSIGNVVSTIDGHKNKHQNIKDWNGAPGPIVKLTTEETRILLEGIKQLIEEYSKNKKEDSFGTLPKLQDTEDILTGKQTLQEVINRN